MCRAGIPAAALPGAIWYGALLAAMVATGCNHTCVSVTSNPPNGILQVKANSNPTCPATTATGAVSVRMVAAPRASAQHIFLSLQGIETHASGAASEPAFGDPDWVELAPQLARHPAQVDLLARSGPPAAAGYGAADRCGVEVLGETTVTAGTYQQIRLRLVPNHPAPGEAVPEENACGKIAYNCVVAADGRIEALALEGEPPELRIVSSGIVGGALLILPEVRTNLAIAFRPDSSFLLPAARLRDGQGESLRLLAAFTAGRETECR